MKTHQFFAPDMHQAMRLARAALGPEAIMLSHKNVPGGVELSMTVAESSTPKGPVPISLINEAPLSAFTPHSSNIKSNSLSVEEQSTKDNAYLLGDMKEELAFLRNTLQKQLSGLMVHNKETANPAYAFLKERLDFLGFSQAISTDVIEHVNKHKSLSEAWQSAMLYLEQILPVSQDNLTTPGSVVALFGPTGVGKTTTIAKLATSFVLKYSASDLGLITTDDYRVTGSEQLMRYGCLLGVETYAAQEPEQLSAALDLLAHKRLVLIDTAGISQRDASRIEEQITFFSKLSRPIKRYLTISGTSQNSVLNEIVAAYKAIHLDGLVITKVDESINLGAALSVAIQHKLPIAYTTNGQQVPQNIKVADAKQLLQLTLKIAEQYDSYSATHRAVDRSQEDAHV